MSRKLDQKADHFAADMVATAEPLNAIAEALDETKPTSTQRPDTTLNDVARLCNEWAEADRSSEKRQQVHGTWAQIWAVGARGVFSVNLLTGSVWHLRRNPPSKPIGNVRTLTGQQLAELIGEK